MNKIETLFHSLKIKKQKALMTHVVIGYPTLADTRKLVNLMVAEGADVIELQIPFSDPMGDGSTIHEANAIAIQNGVLVKDAFALVRMLREKDGIKIPLLFMTYANIPFRYGFEKFCIDSKAAGIDGLIIPDYNLVFEDIDNFEKISRKHGLSFIRFISLDSDRDRIKKLSMKAEGFLYCFSVRGITGGKLQLEESLISHLNNIKNISNLPIAVGFGISSKVHMRALREHTDMVIVGSAMIEAFNKGGFKEVRALMKELRSSLSE